MDAVPMIENEERARAEECLCMAIRAGNEDDEHSWLALAESWLQTAQLRQESDSPPIPAWLGKDRRKKGAGPDNAMLEAGAEEAVAQ
jgi:hypothetical protein